MVYRSDSETLRAMLEAAEARAHRAEERVVRLEAELRRGRRGALPTEHAILQLTARGVPTRTGPVDLDLVCLARIGDDPERREAAARHFVEGSAADLAAAAAPLVEGALRRVLALRGAGDLTTALDRVTEDVRRSAQSALRDLGLEIGDVLLAPPGGLVMRVG
jgi:hypothetical protein